MQRRAASSGIAGVDVSTANRTPEPDHECGPNDDRSRQDAFGSVHAV